MHKSKRVQQSQSVSGTVRKPSSLLQEVCLTGWKASSERIVYVENLIVKFCAVLIPISHSVNLDQVIFEVPKHNQIPTDFYPNACEFLREQ